MSDVIDTTATVVEESQFVSVRKDPEPIEVTAWVPKLAITIEDAVQMVADRDEFMSKVMREKLDYGVIPGTNSKPSLLKPGAERLLTAYGLHPELDDEVPPVLDMTGVNHDGEIFIQFRRRCRIWRQTGMGERDRMLIASASGECNSWEKKYRWRKAERLCPSCEQPAIRKAKDRDEFYCWAKIGGCGATFRGNHEKIVNQEVGQVPNPDVADQMNTILKMADKRALVAATIIATGWSDIVTQDMEDFAPNEAGVTAVRTQPPVSTPVAAPPVGADNGGALEPGERFTEGSWCPTCQSLKDDTARDVVIGKLKIAKGGQFRGKLQCSGKVDGNWANHPAPVSQADEAKVEQMVADGDIDPDQIPF